MRERSAIWRRLAVVLTTLMIATTVVAVPALAVQDSPWLIDGATGGATIVADGASGPAVFNYAASSADLFNEESSQGSWRFRAVAATTGTLTSTFVLEGDHGDSTLRLDKIDSDGFNTFYNEVQSGPFVLTDTITWNVVAGEEYGFNINGNTWTGPESATGTLTLDGYDVSIVGGPGVGANVPPGSQLGDQIRVDGPTGQFDEFIAVLSPGLSYVPGSTQTEIDGVSDSNFADPQITIAGDGTETLSWTNGGAAFPVNVGQTARLFFDYEVDAGATPGPAEVTGSINSGGAIFSSATRAFTIGSDPVPSTIATNITLPPGGTDNVPFTVEIETSLVSGPDVDLASVTAEFGTGNSNISFVPGSGTVTDALGTRQIDPTFTEGGSLFYNIDLSGVSLPVTSAVPSTLTFQVISSGSGSSFSIDAASTGTVAGTFSSDFDDFTIFPLLEVDFTEAPAEGGSVSEGTIETFTVEVTSNRFIFDLDSIDVMIGPGLNYVEGSASVEDATGVSDPGGPDADPLPDGELLIWRNVGQVDDGQPLTLSFDYEVTPGFPETPSSVSVEVNNGSQSVTDSVNFTINPTPAASGEVSLLQAVPIPAANGNPASVGLVGSIVGDPSATGDITVFRAETCSDGIVDEGALVIGTQTGVGTDANGEAFFAIAVPSDAQDGFVAARFGTGSLSSCVVLGPDNDSWTRALTVSPGSTTSGFIDSPGVARWYKFPIQPGAQATINLTGLGENYDIAVFKDIAQAYDELSNPEEDLHRLSAEFAPSVFSPSVFSPSVFSPSVFSPDAYAPSVFSPSVFSPSVFSPSVFSPSVFSPSVFSPSVFSPSVFSPSVFSPSVFSPSVFSPSVFSPSVFSSAQSRSIVGVSANEGTAAESVVANTWNNTGEYYVRVTGRNGVSNSETPFQVNVELEGTFCVAGLDTPQPRTPQAGSTVDSVFVWDRSRIEGTEAEKDALFARLTTLAARPEVDGVIIDVSADTEVAALRAQALATPSCVYATNLVAESIKNLVDTYRNPQLTYVTLVGADDSIPFFRYPDQALLGPEQDYEPPVADDTASQAALRLNYIMGQDEYGSRITVSQGDGVIPIPDLAVGRLVETAAEATGVIDAYLTTANGVVASESSYTTGYDFLTDSATEVAENLEAGTGGPENRLIDPADRSPDDPLTWTALDLEAGLLEGPRDDLVFLAGHFSANSALAADYETSLITTQLRDSTKDFTNSIVFSGGCHSGYNIPDGEIVPGVTLPLDWAQAFAQKQATLIAGTGYQYGDTDFVEYSERLYVGFSEQLRADTGAPIAVGNALNAAKQRYLETTPDLRGLHRKSLIIATVFGLPMISVDMPNRIAQPSTPDLSVNPQPVQSGPGDFLDLEVADISLDTSATVEERVGLTNLEDNTEVGGWYYEGPQGVVTNPAEPAIPLFQRDVSVDRDGLVLRGVGFRGGSYTQDSRVPLTGAPTTELRGVHVPFASTEWFPLRIATTNYLGELNGGESTTTLSVTPVQHRVESLGDFAALRRQFDDVGLRLFYSGNTTEYADGAIPALAAAPTISDVSAVVDGGDVVFSAEVLGDPSAGIQEVWVTYTNPVAASPEWASVDLVQDTDNPTRWTATLTGGAALGELQFVVQAANGVGLVGVDDNLGTYFSIGEVVDPGQPAPAVSTLELGGATSGAFGSEVAVSATLTSDQDDAGKQIIFTLGSVTAVGTTNNAGTASVTVPLNTNAGSFTLSAAFTGDSDTQPSSAERAFTVSKSTTALTVEAPAAPVAAGSPVDLSAVLTRPNNGFINERTVFFTIDGPGGEVTVPAITNFAGRASIPGGEYAPGTYTVTARFLGDVPSIGVLDDPTYLPSNATTTFSVEGQPTDRPTIIYVSSTSRGTVGGVQFRDSDIVSYDVEAASWTLVFDASKVGVNRDLNGFEVISGDDGIERIRMSFQQPGRLPGIGWVDDSDIVEFTPTGFGAATAGTFSRVLDGSDVSLSSWREDIDAITSDEAAAPIVSTLGQYRVPGTAGPRLWGTGEDLIRLDNAQLGANTAGTFSRFFDGLSAGTRRNVSGAWADNETGDLYLAAIRGINLPGAQGDGDDIYAYGANGFAKFFDGDAVGFGGEQIDGLHIELGDFVPPEVPADPDFKVYVSSSSSGTVGGLSFNGEDVLEWDSATESWSMFFDGSAFGLAPEDVDGFDIRNDGSLAISLRTPFAGFDDSDVLLVSDDGFELLLDGSAVGLTSNSEDVSAVATTEGQVVVSTYARAWIPQAGRFEDEDLIGFDNGASMVFDGSDVRLRFEDIVGASLRSDDLYLSVRGSFHVGGVSGNGNDVLRFTGTTGSSTAGSFEKFSDGDQFGFGGEQIDALHVVVDEG